MIPGFYLSYPYTISSAINLLLSFFFDAETQAPLRLGTEEQDCEQKMIQLKDIVSRNAANMPKVVKRVRECIETIHKLDSLDGRTIHPAFTRRRIN